MSAQLPPLSKADYYLQDNQTLRELNRELGFIDAAKEEADKQNAKFIEQQSSNKALDIIQLTIKDSYMSTVFQHWKTTLAGIVTVGCFIASYLGVDPHIIQTIQALAVSLGLISAADGSKSN